MESVCGVAVSLELDARKKVRSGGTPQPARQRHALPGGREQRYRVGGEALFKEAVVAGKARRLGLFGGPPKRAFEPNALP